MISILEKPFDPWQVTQNHQQKMQRDGEYGACATFVGTMRDLNEGDMVSAMELEHYR